MFWLDNWLKNRSLLEILNLHVDEVSRLYVTLNEFITSQKRWDLCKLNQVIHNSTIIQQKRGIDILFSNIEDFVVEDCTAPVSLRPNLRPGWLIKQNL